MIRANSVERRKYRTEIPNIVDDLGLSVYAYRLYGHIRRVAGESGECFQSTSTLARACGMSAGKISDAKKELSKPRRELSGLPLIRISKRDQPPGILKRKGDSIKIVDVWEANYALYSKKSKGKIHTMNDDVHHMTGSVHEARDDRSSGEIKKEPIEERTHEERAVADATTHSQAVRASGLDSTAIDVEDDGIINGAPVIDTTPAAPPNYTPAKGRAVPLPVPFQITGEMRDWAGKNVRPGVDIDRTTEKFEIHFEGEKSRDWLKKWKIWMLNEQGEQYGYQYKSKAERDAEILAGYDFKTLASNLIS